MSLGNFSISLAVKDLQASRKFYETLGFSVFHDQSAHNWMILKSPTATVGLFQGMFEGNIMTFNPGWDADGQAVTPFEDVRAMQKRLKAAGVEIAQEADEASTGPASFMVTDPDGNMIMIDQHVDTP
ncbi:MAG: VOC family protein [Hyphomonadaceae bacterium]